MSNVVKGFPPNYGEIISRIPAVRKNPYIVFTYGGTIYNPSGTPLDEAFLAHENTHVEEQRVVGAEAWWERYLDQPEYRLEQELLAYQVQYKYAVQNYSRADRRRLLAHISKDLSGAMYGKLITRQEASDLITAVI